MLISFTQRWKDVRDGARSRVIELATDFTNVDDINTASVHLSKSRLNYSINHLKSVVDVSVAGAGSEVKDTARLYFVNAEGETLHYDIVDPVDDLFLSTAGEGANVVRDYDEMAAASGDDTATAAVYIIDTIVAGDILLGDGEAVSRYRGGRRIV